MEAAAAREERMKEKIELEAKVDRNAYKLSRILRLSSEGFRRDAEKDKKWWDLLEFDEPKSQHVVKRLSTLHEFFQAYDFLEREGSAFARRLAFDGRCICTVCYKTNQVAGLFLANATSAKQHANDEEEYARRVDTQAQSQKRQRALAEDTGEAKARAAQAAAAAAATAAAAADEMEEEGQYERQ